jgi:hypothetical protein
MHRDLGGRRRAVAYILVQDGRDGADVRCFSMMTDMSSKEGQTVGFAIIGPGNRVDADLAYFYLRLESLEALSCRAFFSFVLDRLPFIICSARDVHLSSFRIFTACTILNFAFFFRSPWFPCPSYILCHFFRMKREGSLYVFIFVTC